MDDIEIGILKPRKLDPKEDAASYQSVEELERVLQCAKDKQIRNIGLTGPYGSGKSSVLRTLMEDKSNGRHFLSISLATLRSDDDLKPSSQKSDKEGETGKEEEQEEHRNFKEEEEHRELLNRKIEYSILQQLIYREKASTVPGSRFKRIIHLTQPELRNLAIYSVLFIVAFAIAFEPKFARIDTFYHFLNFGTVWNAFFDALALGYMGLCIFYCIKYLIQAYSNSKLNKLNVKDGEIGLKEEETSIFNKHLDEIIYFFRAANQYDTVIIEDLDRFNSPDIYLKLRELNQILNDCEEIEQHIVFIYAVKDDVFQDSERTKFFDYLITIIPVINPSNSPDKLKKELEKINLDGKISDDALSEIGFFIQDMRILKNIVHELEEYKSKLIEANNQQLDLTKLLAMMVYKNYHPRDFSELHQRKGKVYQALSLKEKFIETALDTLKEEELQIERDENLLAQNRDLSEIELRYAFVYQILQKASSATYLIEVGNNFRGINEICSNKDLFNEFLQLSHLHYRYNGGYSSGSNSISINILSEFRDKGFEKRISLLGVKEKNVLSNRRLVIERKKRGVHALSFSQLLVQYPTIRNHKDYLALELPELIDVFLKSGYLDEDYYDYISYFYPGMLSPTDREYLLAIKRLEDPVYEQKIDKIDNFVQKLTPRNFETDSILNVQLVDYVLRNRHNPEIKVLESCLIELIDREDAPYDFWNAFYQKSQNPQRLFSNIIPKHKERTWFDIEGLEDSILENLREGFLRFCGDLGKDEPWILWLNNNYAFFRKHSAALGQKRIESLLAVVSFEKLDAEDSRLLLSVLTSNSFSLNAENVRTAVEFFYQEGKLLSEALTISNILLIPDKNILDYLIGEHSLPSIFQFLTTDFKEESINAIEHVLKSKLNIDQKKSFFHDQQARREDVSNLEPDKAMLLYVSYIIAPTWENAYYLYELCQDSKGPFINYVSHYFRELSAQNSADVSDHQTSVFDLLFGNNDFIDDSVYEGLLDAFNLECDGDDYLKDLSPKRISFLLQNGKLPFNDDNLDKMNQSASLVDYLLFHKDSFLSSLDKHYNLSSSSTAELLKRGHFKIEDQRLILEKIGYDVILENQYLSKSALEFFGNILIDLTLSIDQVINLMEVAKDISLNVATANYLIESQPDIDHSIIQTILKAIGYESLSLVADRDRQPKITKNGSTRKLLETLKSRGFISSYTEKDTYFRPNYFKTK